MVRPKRRANRNPRKPSRPTRLGLEKEGSTNPIDDHVDSGAIFEIGEDVRFASANSRGVSLHNFQAGADVRSQVNLVNDQKSGVGDSGSAFSRNFVALGNVNHVNRSVDQFRTERSGQVVSATLDEEQVKLRKGPLEHGTRFQIYRSIFTDGGMRASTRLDSHDSLGREYLATHKEFGILARIDVIRDHSDAIAGSEMETKRLDQGCLARAYRASYSNL